jgi:hypothetical protein
MGGKSATPRAQASYLPQPSFSLEESSPNKNHTFCTPLISILIYVLLKSPFLMLKSTTFYFFYFSVIKQSYKTMVFHIFSWFHFPKKP